MRPATAVRKVFGTIGPTGAAPSDPAARRTYDYQVAEAENFERSFLDCKEHSDYTVEHIVLRCYQQLRGEAQASYVEEPLEAKAMDALADHIEDGFGAWYSLMNTSRRADRDAARRIRGRRGR